MEIFRPIKSYEGVYSISNVGRVRSERNGKMLKPATDKYGYLYFVLCVNGKRKTVKAHRLVASAFIENPLNKPTVDHLNCDKKDNRVENLAWATNKEQSNNPITYKKLATRDSAELLLERGRKRNFGRKSVCVYKNGKFVGVYPSLKTAAISAGANYAKASECANGKRKQTAGYTFEWAS